MKRFFVYILFTILFFSLATSQTMKDLEKQRKQAQKNLQVTNQLLKENNKEKQSSVNAIKLLNQNIKDRQNVISTINQELSVIDFTIDTLKTERDELVGRLGQVKLEYAKLTRLTHYRRGTINYLSFILSSDNFNQMFRRLRYLQQFSSYRKQQIREIEKITQQLDSKEEELLQTRNTKSEILQIKQNENRKLEDAKIKENKMLEDLKKKEKTLLVQQKKQQRLAEDLNKKIQQMIDAEIAKEKKKSGTKTSTGSKIVMTKEETLIAGNFEKNRGRLPWPVEKGYVSGHFGIQQHPVLEHVTMNNKGIYIQTTAGADARSIFEGVVTQCFSIPGSNNAVIIKHGNYRTVYTNLTTLYVKEGDKVSAKQKVGKIFVDTENENKTEMLLMLYLDTTLKDPEPWLAK